MGIRPPPSALASIITSGTTPSASQANRSPVRPRPVWISSRTSRTPASSADRADLGEVAGGRLHDAALALDRLDEEGRVMPRPIGQGPAQRVDVTVRHLVEVRRRRAEVASDSPGCRWRRAPRASCRGSCPCVERMPQPPRGGPAELDRGLDGLGAAVGERHPAEPLGGDLHQPCRELARRVEQRGLHETGLAPGPQPLEGTPDRRGDCNRTAGPHRRRYSLGSGAPRGRRGRSPRPARTAYRGGAWRADRPGGG